jgi:hypothetical protein
MNQHACLNTAMSKSALRATWAAILHAVEAEDSGITFEVGSASKTALVRVTEYREPSQQAALVSSDDAASPKPKWQPGLNRDNRQCRAKQGQ